MKDRIATLSGVLVILLIALILPSGILAADNNASKPFPFSLYISGGISMPLNGPLRTLEAGPTARIGFALNATRRISVGLGADYYRYAGYVPELVSYRYENRYSGGVRQDLLYGVLLRFDVYHPKSSKSLPESKAGATGFLITLGTGPTRTEVSEVTYQGEVLVPQGEWNLTWWSAGLAVERQVHSWVALCVEGRFIMLSDGDLRSAMVTFGARLL